MRAVSAAQARARHREWLSETEARINNIRAERKGEGRTLTTMQARALSGDRPVELALPGLRVGGADNEQFHW